MSKYEKRLKSTAFVITVNTNKVPLQLSSVSKKSSFPDPERFREDLTQCLKEMVSNVDNVRQYFGFWKKLKRRYGEVDSEFHWGNTWDGTQVIRFNGSRLIEQINFYIGIEVGPKYHRLHAHIMTEVVHRGKLKVKVGSIVDKLKRIENVSAAHISSIINLFTSDPRVNIFNYVNKSNIVQPGSDVAMHDKYSGDRRHQWERINRPVDDIRDEYGYKIIYLNRNLLPIMSLGNDLDRNDRYPSTKYKRDVGK